MIKIENVNYRYKNSENILENVNLEIKEGECVCIVGKNGAGKSTLAKLITGIIKPTIGEILVDNISTSNKNKVQELRKKIGIVFQNPENQIIFSQVYDDIAFAINNLNLNDEETRIEKALQKVNMEEYIRSNTHELSLGQKQRITIAGVLATSTKYIVLDEATAMLDSKGKEEIYKIIDSLKQNGYTIIYTTNISDELLIADKIIILDKHKIVAQIYKTEVVEKIEILKKYGIKLPNILEIIDNLKQENILINLEKFTIKELTEKIVSSFKEGKRAT